MPTHTNILLKTLQATHLTQIFDSLLKVPINPATYSTNEPMQFGRLFQRAITTAQLHSTKPELRFCAGSNPARGVSEIRNGEDL